jgi:hypothetical protein
VEKERVEESRRRVFEKATKDQTPSYGNVSDVNALDEIWKSARQEERTSTKFIERFGKVALDLDGKKSNSYTMEGCEKSGQKPIPLTRKGSIVYLRGGKDRGKLESIGWVVVKLFYGKLLTASKLYGYGFPMRAFSTAPSDISYEGFVDLARQHADTFMLENLQPLTSDKHPRATRMTVAPHGRVWPVVEALSSDNSLLLQKHRQVHTKSGDEGLPSPKKRVPAVEKKTSDSPQPTRRSQRVTPSKDGDGVGKEAGEGAAASEDEDFTDSESTDSEPDSVLIVQKPTQNKSRSKTKPANKPTRQSGRKPSGSGKKSALAGGDVHASIEELTKVK